jgi:hypothetical protein
MKNKTILREIDLTEGMAMDARLASGQMRAGKNR